MKILHFNQFGGPAGGVERYVAEVSRALAAARHESRLVSFAPEHPGDLSAGTVQIDGSDLKAGHSAIDKVIADFGPDVAYIHAVYDPRTVGWITARLPAVVYVHSPYLVCPGYALYLRRSGQICGRSVSLWCLVNAQIQRCCFGRNPIRHVRRLRQVLALLDVTAQVDMLVGSEYMRRCMTANGVQAERVSLLAPLLLPEPPSDCTRPGDSKAVLYAGRITPEKGLRHLIRAFATAHSGWQLIVAGEGPDRSACQQLADRLGVAQRVEFTGWATHTEMRRLYKLCAFVVVPSLWPEPYGRVGPEAFLHGRPVIAYAVGGIPEWMEDGVTGYLATPGSVESLCEAIVRLMDNPQERERMGHAARDRASVRWRAQTHVDRLAQHFNAAIDGFCDVSPGA